MTTRLTAVWKSTNSTRITYQFALDKTVRFIPAVRILSTYRSETPSRVHCTVEEFTGAMDIGANNTIIWVPREGRVWAAGLMIKHNICSWNHWYLHSIPDFIGNRIRETAPAKFLSRNDSIWEHYLPCVRNPARILNSGRWTCLFDKRTRNQTLKQNDFLVTGVHYLLTAVLNEFGTDNRQNNFSGDTIVQDGTGLLEKEALGRVKNRNDKAFYFENQLSSLAMLL